MVPVMIAHLGLGCVLVSFPGKSWVNVWFCVQKALARSGHDRSCHLAGQSWCPLASQSCEPKAKTGYQRLWHLKCAILKGLGSGTAFQDRPACMRSSHVQKSPTLTGGSVSRPPEQHRSLLCCIYSGKAKGQRGAAHTSEVTHPLESKAHFLE